MVIASSSMLLKCATVHYPSTERSKYSNCTVNPSEYDEQNQGIHFHYQWQAHLQSVTHYFG